MTVAFFYKKMPFFRLFSSYIAKKVLILRHNFYLSFYMKQLIYSKFSFLGFTLFAWSLLLGSSSLCHAQTNASLPPKIKPASSDSVLTLRDTLWLVTSAPGVTANATPLFLQYRLKRGQTLFQLAAFFKVSVDELRKANPAMSGGTANSAGQYIFIPITKEHIIRAKPNLFSWKSNLRVLFKTRTETLYRVAKTYLDVPIDTIKVRNRLTSDALPFGRVLNVGWISLGGVRLTNAPLDTAKKLPIIIPEALRVALVESERLKAEYAADVPQKKEIHEKGIAFWDNQDRRGIRENKQLFVLHRSAPIGSTIRISNPMFHRTLFVKVIGRIPTAGYTPDVTVVVSPFCAKTLGAIDSRFHIELRYLL